MFASNTIVLYFETKSNTSSYTKKKTLEVGHVSCLAADPRNSFGSQNKLTLLHVVKSNFGISTNYPKLLLGDHSKHKSPYKIISSLHSSISISVPITK